MCPTRADGISSWSPSAMPNAARSTGTSASFLPAMTSVSWQLDLTRQSTGAAECAGHALGNDDRGTLLPAQFLQFPDRPFHGNGGESGEFLRRLPEGIAFDFECQGQRADRRHELG